MIKNYRKITKPLIDLTQKDKGFKWDLAQKQVFKYLKKVITKEPIVKPVNPDMPFEIKADTLKDTTGVILV